MRGLVGSGLFAVTVGVAVFRVLASRPSHDAAQLPDTVAREVFLEATSREPGERREAAFRFPGSLWSQEDDFFAKETAFVKGFAEEKLVSVGAILFALDRGIREKWPTRDGVVVNPRVVPCRPRLAYH